MNLLRVKIVIQILYCTYIQEGQLVNRTQCMKEKKHSAIHLLDFKTFVRLLL